MPSKEYNFIKEVREQPAVIRSSLEQADAHFKDLATRYVDQIDRIVMVGCGDPYMLGIGATYAFENWAHLPAESIEAAEFAVYRHSLVDDKTLVILISSSGKTVKVIDAARLAKQRNASMFALTNIEGSLITQETDEVMITQAGRSDAYPAKQTTTALANLLGLALHWAQVAGTMSADQFDELHTELYQGVPNAIEQCLKLESDMRVLADLYLHAPMYTFIGSGPSLSAALLAAAKMKETSQSRSEACNMEEYAHLYGLSLKKKDPVFIYSYPGDMGERNRKLGRYIKSNGGEIIAVGPISEISLWEGIADHLVKVPDHNEMFGPLVSWIPLQIFAYYVSAGRGLNPDRPIDRADPGYLQEIIYTSVLDGYYER